MACEALDSLNSLGRMSSGHLLHGLAQGRGSEAQAQQERNPQAGMTPGFAIMLKQAELTPRAMVLASIHVLMQRLAMFRGHW